MDAAEYKHVVLGLIFLKYIPDSFEEHHACLVAGKGEFEGADPEERDEYLAHNVFWVPKEARWPFLQASAKQPTIGKLLDDAMVAIEHDNARVKGVLPRRSTVTTASLSATGITRVSDVVQCAAAMESLNSERTCSREYNL